MCVCVYVWERGREKAWCQSHDIDFIAYVDKQAPSLVLSSQCSGHGAIKVSAASLIAPEQ